MSVPDRGDGWGGRDSAPEPVKPAAGDGGDGGGESAGGPVDPKAGARELDEVFDFLCGGLFSKLDATGKSPALCLCPGTSREIKRLKAKRPKLWKKLRDEINLDNAPCKGDKLSLSLSSTL